MRGEREEVGAVRVGGEGVAERGDQGPGAGGGAKVVVGGFGEEGRVACIQHIVSGFESQRFLMVID